MQTVTGTTKSCSDTGHYVQAQHKTDDRKSQPLEKCLCLTYWLLQCSLPNLNSAATCYSRSFLLDQTPHCNPDKYSSFIPSKSSPSCRLLWICEQSESHFRCFKECQKWLILPTAHTDYGHLRTSRAIHHGVARTAPAIMETLPQVQRLKNVCPSNSRPQSEPTSPDASLGW